MQELHTIIFCLLLAGTAESRVSARRSNCPTRQSQEIGTPQPAVPVTTRVNTRHRILDLRAAMKNVELVRGPSLDAYVITSDDEHQSEAVSSHDQRRNFISGFSGSQGEVVITNNSSALWTDARNFQQADAELACYWQIMRTGMPKVPTIAEWLGQQLRSRARVGADPRLIAHHVWLALESDLAKLNISLVDVSSNLVDHIWTKNRPTYSSTAFVHSLEYAGEPWMSKVKQVRGAFDILGVQAQVITALDEIAWLFNIRGRHAPFLPVVRAYVLLSLDRIDMYVTGGTLPESVRVHLHSDNCFNEYCVRLHPYDHMWGDLKTMSQAWRKVLVPAAFSYSQGASHAIYSSVSSEKRVSRPSPVMLLKAVKNPVESAGMRRAHIRDAAAICLFMAYLEETLEDGKNWDEAEVAKMVDEFRMDQPLSEGPSFRTIAGFGSNGALPHYRPRAYSSSVIGTNSTLVIDSGGQYLDGTTDVTRTFHFGRPTKQQLEAYTRVLAGQLSLARLVFPNNVDTSDVDVLARAPLWQVGMDYKHGTGHGIGTYLSVHEPPLNINYNSKYKKIFEVGNFFSDEPGYYKEGDFGVRLENILEVVPVKTKYNVSGPYLGFRAVTLVPYEPKLINPDLLTPDLRRMLNEYNARVRIEVGPELKKKVDMKGFRWMMNKTGYIPEWSPPSSCSLLGVRVSLWMSLVFPCLLLVYS